MTPDPSPLQSELVADLVVGTTRSATSSGGLVAVVPVRGGLVPLGGAEAVAEVGGSVVLVGDGCEDAVAALIGIATEVHVVELDAYAPRRAAAAVTQLLTTWGLDPTAAPVVRNAAEHPSILLPASPDGRDLAPLLAHALGHPLLAGAVEVHTGGARLARHGGFVMEDVVVDGAFVATLQPGVRGCLPDPTVAPPGVVDRPTVDSVEPPTPTPPEPVVVRIEPPDPATIDLGEAPRIMGGGAGLGSPDAMGRLGEVAEALGCSLGATRVVTDWGWAPFKRQIGTTGVMVHPELYVAFGISGAVQHTAGLGHPSHIISVNLDASCPMMSLADLAVVADAPAVVDALLAKLESRTAHENGSSDG